MSKSLLEQALRLKPHEKFAIIEGLLQSLDEPNKNLDEIWAIEAQKRLEAYRNGTLKGVPMEKIFENQIIGQTGKKSENRNKS
ncbi:Putative addiction module domain-containing protein, CHP02574 [Desulfonema limicola]|uniref:Addiction module domain-containing protein, CHP02574 n=1 Tax=Desulfonema limicola TaxID=45656 RepID=A0A975GI11_9BACT|nr:addiction module protein [Desulfonema limicola]QTA82125.1 Putative addiction module domain-containing protein, CHP02574 [Desulfonema limicola]